MQVFTVPSTAGSEGPAVLTRDATRRSAAGATVSVAQQRRNLTVGGILVVVKGERAAVGDDVGIRVTLVNPGVDPITNLVFADRSGVSLETVGTSASPLSHTATVTPTPLPQLDPTHAISLIYALQPTTAVALCSPRMSPG